jgi:hypothetical protein
VQRRSRGRESLTDQRRAEGVRAGARPAGASPRPEAGRYRRPAAPQAPLDLNTARFGSADRGAVCPPAADVRHASLHVRPHPAAAKRRHASGHAAWGCRDAHQKHAEVDPAALAHEMISLLRRVRAPVVR